MSEKKFAENLHYREYERLLIELHRLTAAGLDDSPEAEALREEMDAPGSWLSREEARRLAGLSGDLFSLHDQECFVEVTDRETAARLELDLDQALKERRWEDVLVQLRKRPRDASTEAVALLRSRAYGELGHPAPAALFFDYALGLNGQESPAVKAIYSPPSSSVPVAA